MKRALLIDADIYIYRAAVAAEMSIEWESDLWTLHADAEEAIRNFDGMIEQVVRKLEAERYILAFSDNAEPNWRNQYLPSYKQNREGEFKRRPLVYRPLREHGLRNHPSNIKPGLEGDDVLGILLTHPNILGEYQKICVSIDKDMRTVPGIHHNPTKETTTVVSEEEAYRYFLTQALTGDRVDGYFGCPGVGPKTAEKWFDKHGVSWSSVVALYEKKGLTEDDALAQARVARICQWQDFDYVERRVIPWTP